MMRTLAHRRAFTLIELLVVIFILVVLTVLAIGIAAPQTQQRRLREAARQTELYLHRARARALELGQVVGVLLVPYRPDPASTAQPFCVQLYTLTLPDPYVGGNLPPLSGVPTQAVILDVNYTPPPGLPQYFVLRVNDAGWQGLIRRGDLIQIGQKGGWHVILGSVDDSGGGSPGIDAQGYLQYRNWIIRLSTIGSSDPIGANRFPFRPGDVVPGGFRVQRMPRPDALTFSTIEPLELPEGVVVDLLQSRIELGPTNMPPLMDPNGNGVLIAFTPQGEMLVLHPTFGLLHGDVFLMVGTQDQVEQINAQGHTRNLLDTETYWVGVNRRTGQVMTAINAGPDPTNAVPDLLDALRFIRSWDSEGGG